MAFTFQDFFKYMKSLLTQDGHGHTFLPDPTKVSPAFYITADADKVGYGYLWDDHESFRAKLIFDRSIRPDTISILQPDSTGYFTLPPVCVSPEDSFCLGDEKTPDNWWQAVHLSQKEFLEIQKAMEPWTMKILYTQEDPDLMKPMPRPDYLTFGDFWNFCRIVQKDPYGIYQPFQSIRRALRFSEGYQQIDFCELDQPSQGYPYPKLTFISHTFDQVIICDVKPSGVDIDNGLAYNMNDPFCFGTAEHPVTWWRTFGLLPDDYEFFRDMLGGFRRGDKVI